MGADFTFERASCLAENLDESNPAHNLPSWSRGISRDTVHADASHYFTNPIMNLMHLSLVLLVVVSTTSDVLGGAMRGQEQDLRHRHLRIACYNDKEEPHGRMNSSKMEARVAQDNRDAKSKSGFALKSESRLHRSHLVRGKDWQEEEQSPY